MSSTARATAIGATFLVVGLLLVALAVLPVVLAALQHPPVHADVSLWFLGIGLGVAILGAWMIPSSGAPAAVTQLVVAIGNTNLPIIGGRRRDDPKAPPPGAAP